MSWLPRSSKCHILAGGLYWSFGIIYWMKFSCIALTRIAFWRQLTESAIMYTAVSAWILFRFDPDAYRLRRIDYLLVLLEIHLSRPLEWANKWIRVGKWMMDQTCVCNQNLKDVILGKIYNWQIWVFSRILLNLILPIGIELKMIFSLFSSTVVSE